MTWEELYARYWQYRNIVSEAQNLGLSPDQARSLVLQEQQRQLAQQQAEQQRLQEEEAIKRGYQNLYAEYYGGFSDIISDAQRRGLSIDQARELIRQEQRRQQAEQLAEQRRKQAEQIRQQAEQQAQQAEQKRQQEELRKQKLSIPQALPSVNVARYQQYLQQNPSMPKGIMAQTFSIPQYGGLQSRLGEMYKQGGGKSLYDFAMKQYDPNVKKTALDYRDYLENLNKQQQSLRSSTMMAGGRIPQPFTNQPKPAAPSAPNYGIGQQRYGSQQSAAARGFYQTPYAYQNL